MTEVVRRVCVWVIRLFVDGRRACLVCFFPSPNFTHLPRSFFFFLLRFPSLPPFSNNRMTGSTTTSTTTPRHLDLLLSHARPPLIFTQANRIGALQTRSNKRAQRGGKSLVWVVMFGGLAGERLTFL